MRDQNKKCVIFALNTGSLKREAEVMGCHQFNYKPLIGSYKGTTEDSYLVICEDPFTTKMVLNLAIKHNQESVLFLREDRSCYLHMLENGENIELGNFKEVEKIDIYKLDAWTLDLKTGRYYSAS